jgi:hypothetical protein
MSDEVFLTSEEFICIAEFYRRGAVGGKHAVEGQRWGFPTLQIHPQESKGTL